MKKIVFCLLAIGMTAFASASNVKPVPVKPVPVKKEAFVKAKKITVKKSVALTVKEEEFKTVKCWGWDSSGHYSSHDYSCFFCWGGSHNGCMAEGGLNDN